MSCSRQRCSPKGRSVLSSLLPLCVLAACGGPPAPSAAGYSDLQRSGTNLNRAPGARTHDEAVQWHEMDERNSLPGAAEDAEVIDEDAVDETRLDEASLDELQLGLTDADPYVRQAVIDEVLWLRRKEAEPYLRAALSDPHAGVRQAAEEALEEMGLMEH